MKTLTLDLATHTGWTLSEAGEITSSGTLHLATAEELDQQRKEGKERTGDIRFTRLLAFILQHIQAGVGRIVFEDVQFTRNPAQSQLWPSLRCAIWAAAQNCPVEICCVQVGTLKRFAAGKGSAQKEDMARALANAEPGRYRLTEKLEVIRADGTPIDDDQVDAIWLARFAMAVDRGEQAFLSGFQRKLAAKLERRAKKAAARARRKARKEAARLAQKRKKRRAMLKRIRESRQVASQTDAPAPLETPGTIPAGCLAPEAPQPEP